MGSLGFPELMLIFVIALIVFGPRRLPDIGRQIGRAMSEFKKTTNEMRMTLEEEVRLEEHKKLIAETNEALSFEPPVGTVAKSRSSEPDAPAPTA